MARACSTTIHLRTAWLRTDTVRLTESSTNKER